VILDASALGFLVGIGLVVLVAAVRLRRRRRRGSDRRVMATAPVVGHLAIGWRGCELQQLVLPARPRAQPATYSARGGVQQRERRLRVLATGLISAFSQGHSTMKVVA
jgi:hypothetical protein